MTDHLSSFGTGVVILAAGASSRMGKPKLLLPWGNTSVLGHLIRQWQQEGAKQIAVVQAADDQAIGAELDRLEFPAGERIANSCPERGMFSSIQCAARWNGWDAALTRWVVVLGDQPHLCQETLRELLDAAALFPDRIWQPGRHGRPRHPVVLPKGIFEQLRDSQEETLKQFLQRNASAVAVRELDDPGLDLDLDTPADYQEAVRRFAGTSG